MIDGRNAIVKLNLENRIVILLLFTGKTNVILIVLKIEAASMVEGFEPVSSATHAPQSS